MNKKILKLFLYLLLPIFITIFALGSVAWFKEAATDGLDTHISQGLVIQQYFHCGDGTKNNPYVITRPIHYYHLVELYQRRSGFANNFTYFQLGYDLNNDGKKEVYNYNDFGETDGTFSNSLNMSYYSGSLSLLPVGTSTAPFFGEFDGSGLTIENLNVVSQEIITLGSSSTTYNSCDIGIFGYVTGIMHATVDGEEVDYISYIKDVYYNNVNISLVGAAAEANVDSSVNVTNEEKHKSHDTGKVYVGYLIGHLNEYANANGRDYANNSVVTPSSPICNVYINNVTVTGGNLSPIYCRYGYIGYVDELDGDTTISLSTLYNELSGTSVGEEGWGGSIDMTSLYNRIVDLGTNDPDTAEAKYVTQETIVAGSSVKDTVLVQANALDELDTDRSDLYYWSAIKDMDTGNATGLKDMSGGALFASRTSTWNYLYGLASETIKTTTYTKTGDEVPAYYIYDTGTYLTFNSENIGTFTTATSTSKATKWIPEDNSASSSYYYCFYYNTKYYINASGTSTITLSTTKQTQWSRNADGEFFTTIGSTNYYLNNDGSWVLVPSDKRYYITDNTHYLAATTSNTYNVTSADEGAIWLYQNINNNAYIREFYFTSSGVKYFLAYNNGLTIIDEATKNQTNSAYKTAWTREIDSTTKLERYYITLNNINYYIVYNGMWQCVRTDGYKIYSGSNYLIANNGTISNGTESQGTIFQLKEVSTNNFTIVADNNGVGTYLSNDGSSLTISNDVSYWHKDENGYFYKTVSVNGSPRENEILYLVYNNGWKLIPSTGVKIYSDLSYLSASLSSGGTSVDIVRTVNSAATIWQMYGKNIYTYIGNQTYYLGINGNGLVITTTKFNWSTDDYGIYGSYNGDNLYITYIDGVWTVVPNSSIYIYTTTSDNTKHYLSFKNSAVVATGITDATAWQVKSNSDDTIYLYQLDGINKHYLSISNNQLAKVSNPSNTNSISKWKRETSGTNYKYSTTIGAITYYLYYNQENNTWEIVALKEYVKLQYKYYSNGVEKTIYLNSNGGPITYTTDSTIATTWTVESSDSGTLIYTYVGTQIYYLNFEEKVVREYQTVTKTVGTEVVQEKKCVSAEIKCVPVTTTTQGASWSFDKNGNFIAIISDVEHYLVFNEFKSEFEFKIQSGLRITDGNGHYIALNVVPKDLNAETIEWEIELGNQSGQIENYPLQMVDNQYRTFNGNVLIFILVGATKYYLTHGNTPENEMSIKYTTVAPTNLGEKDSNDKYRFFVKDNEFYIVTFDTTFKAIWETTLKRWEFIPQGYTGISATYNGKTYYYYHQKNSTNLLSNTISSTMYRYFFYTWSRKSVGTDGGFYLHFSEHGNTNALTCDNSGTLSVVKEVSATASTWSAAVWYIDSTKNNQYYTKINGLNYYLYYNGSTWYCQPDTMYDLSATDGNKVLQYLVMQTNSSGKAELITSTSQGLRWYKSWTGSTWVLYNYAGGSFQYLKWSKTEGLVLTTTRSEATNMKTDSNGIYFLVDSVKYYLTYETYFNFWELEPESYYDWYNQDGTTGATYFWFNRTDSCLYELTSNDHAVKMMFSNPSALSDSTKTTTISFIFNCKLYYLHYAGANAYITCSTDSTQASNFTKNGTAMYMADGDNYRYLQVKDNRLYSGDYYYYYLKASDTMYLKAESNGNITTATELSKATKIYVEFSSKTFSDKVIVLSDGTKFIRKNNFTGTAITFGTSGDYKKCTYDGSKLYVYRAGVNFYFVCKSDGWTCDRTKSNGSTVTFISASFWYATSAKSSGNSKVYSASSCSASATKNTTLNENVYNLYNTASIYKQTLSGSIGVPDATSKIYYLDTTISTVNLLSSFSSSNPNSITLTFTSNVYTSGSSINVDETYLKNNLKFDGRSIQALGGTITYSGSGKNIVVTIPSKYTSMEPNQLGYTHHTLSLVVDTAYKSSVLGSFKMYLVSGSWTQSMPRSYGLIYINGYFAKTDNISKSTTLSTSTIINDKAKYSDVINIAKAVVSLFDIKPTLIKVDAKTSNPTVTILSTKDRLYVSTTSEYKRGTYIPLCFTDENGDQLEDYAAFYKNTGYIVGGTYSSASGSGKGDIRISRYGSGNISESYYDGEWDTIYTFNDSGTSPVAINDSSNSYVNYESSKNKFKTILDQNENYVFGLHFMDSSITKQHTIYAESVLIQNKYYSNYELPESSIDFNVYSQGYITLWAGDYYTSGNSSFFSLHKVYRNSQTNAIEKIVKIEEVYAKDGMTTRDYYIYKVVDEDGKTFYTSSTNPDTLVSSLASGYYSVFKMKWLESPTNGNDFSNDYIYYFEIPCNKGEYALGSVEGSDGGYLLYLDIATNGNQGYTYDEESAIAQNPIFTQIDYLSSGKVVNSRIIFEYGLANATDSDEFSVNMVYNDDVKVFDDRYGIDVTFFTITITNKTGSDFDLTVILIDDDDDPDNALSYRYKIIYNGKEYMTGDSYDAITGSYVASGVFRISN